MFPAVFFLLFLCVADAGENEKENIQSKLQFTWRNNGRVGFGLRPENDFDFSAIFSKDSTNEKPALSVSRSKGEENATSKEEVDGLRAESSIGKSSIKRNQREVNLSEWPWPERGGENLKNELEIEIKGSSLVFVFDSTGSMKPELNQVKVGASKILEALSGNPDIPIHNYILVPFNDPVIGPVTVTTDHELFKENIQNITVFGGGDCPEMSISAIKKALEESLPNSYIYVFTDASAKDYKLLNEVLSLIQRKRSQVNFIMTDSCGDFSEPAHQVYEKISATSTGQIFWLDESEVKEVLKYIKLALQSNVVNLFSQQKPAPSKDIPDEHEVLIDNTLKQFTVSVSGINASIIIMDPKGKTVEGPPQLELLLSLGNVKIVNVKKPDPGPWKIFIYSDSDYMLRSTGKSEVNFDHGFSTVETINMKETNYRPLKGALCFLLIRTFDMTIVHNVTEVDLIDVNGKVIKQLHLESVSDIRGLYKTEAFIPPTQFFHLGISGYGKDGLPIKRITSTAINPQLPEKPIINVRPRVIAFFNASATLKCYVESAVPIAVQWYKDGGHNGSYKNCSQSCEAIIQIERVTMQSEGNYTCIATNTEGTSLESQFLEVIGEAPIVIVNSTIFTSVGENVSLPCSVHSYLPYVVTWNQFTEKNEHSDTLYPVSNGWIEGNHTLNLGPVQMEDEGWYVCIAKNKVGQKQGWVFLVVKVPLTVVVEPQTKEYTEGTSLLFSCMASGKPQPKLEWWKQQKKITDEDPSIMVKEVNGYLNLVIEYLLKKHEGIYTCIATNSEESAMARAELIYTAEPQIETENQTLWAKYGGEIILNCKASGRPKPIIKWYKDGNEIILDSRVEMNENGELKIKFARMSDSGAFSCMATNNLGSATNYISVLIGTAPVFLHIPKDKRIEVHQKSTLTCSAIGIPLPKIKWSRQDGRELNLESTVQHNGELRILRMNAEDAGYYECTAENSFGSISAQIKLEIVGIEKPLLNELSTVFEVKGISGSDLTIPCGITLGNPVGNLKWIKDHSVVKESDRVMINHNGDLVIHKAEIVNAGRYTCFVSNIAGNSSRSIEISISESPTTAKNLSTNLKGQKGGEIIIPCLTEGFPAQSIMWKKDGRPLPRSSTTFQDENGSLIIRNLSEENSGTYTCSGENFTGPASQVISLRVQVPPIFTEDAQDQYLNIVEGYAVVLNCNSKAVPRATVEWYKNEKPLLQGEELIREQPEILRFMANVDDTGMYECIAANEAGSASKKFNVTVLVPPSILDGENEESVKAKEGIRMILKCKVHGIPTPTILWQRNGMYLTQNTSDITLTDSGLLILENVTSESAGAYTCDAENLAGIIQRMYYVQVNYAPRIKEENDINHTISLKEGSEYSLPCRVEGNPKPHVTWRKNGFVVRDNEKDVSDNLLVLGDNTLVLSQVNKESKGIYRCEAKNEEGSTFREYDIEVLTLPFLRTETYHTKKKVNEGDPVVLTCPVSNSIPSPILWIKDGKPMNSLLQGRSDEVQIKLSENQRKLTIAEAHPSDRGNYSCSAINSTGRVDAKFFVDVLMTPHFEEFKHMAHRTILVGGDVALNCSVTGNPQPQVTWRKGNTPITADNNLGVDISLDKQYLVISNGKVNHTGTYICTAINEVSRKEREFYITVLEPPLIMGSPYEVVDVVIGSNLSLHCSYTGVPKPEIVWWKQKNTKETISNFSEDLEIVGVDSEDGGIYICEVTNIAGTKIKKFNVTVLEPPDIEPNNAVEKLVTHEGGNVSMKCQTKGHPKPDITWLHNGHVINEIQSKKSRRQIKEFLGELQIFENGLVKLTLSNVTEDYEGLYTILASNKAGVTEKSFEVSVLNVNLNYSGKYMCIISNIAGIFKVTYATFEAPKQMTPVDAQRNIQLHHPFSLNCPFDGRPEPNITWYLNGEKIVYNNYDDDIQIAGMYLMVLEATIEHAGEYKCVAQNVAGSKELIFVVDLHVPAEWSFWSAWSPCTVTCGTGEQRRTRNCNASYEGLNSSIKTNSSKCIGESWIEKRKCFKECPIDDKWETWSTWTPYSSTCGMAVRKRFRSCNNTKSFTNGKNCDGPRVEEEFKMMDQCPINGKWSEWSHWSACSHSCDGGMKERHRKCTSPAPQHGGKFCSGFSKEFENCNKQKCQGEWLPWSEWSPCSVSCGTGQQKRHRKCALVSDCNGNNFQIQKCFIRNCEDRMLLSISNLIKGEGPIVRHKEEEMDSDEALQNEAEVLSEISVAKPHAEIATKYLDQNYIQTSPYSLLSTVKNDVDILEKKFPFPWNSIIYKDTEQIMSYLAKKLLNKDIHDAYNRKTQNVTYISASNIGKKYEYNKCPAGFIHEPQLMHCTDINECENASFQCGSDQHCQNTIGSYNCICNGGYRMSSDSLNCVDIDECTEMPNVCSHFCHNVKGSFFCSCPFRHNLDKDLRTCKEISYNDAEIYRDGKNITEKNISHNSHLRKYEFRMEEISEKDKKCPPGFFLFNLECKDLNECEDFEVCDYDEICLNTLGSYQCLNVPCPIDFVRNLLTQNCIKICSKEKSCKNKTLVSETIIFSAVTLNSTSPLQSIAHLNVQSEEGVKIVTTKFQIVESEELFQVRESLGKGWLFVIRVLNKNTLYRVKVEANSYDKNNVFVYNANYIIFVIVI